MLQAADRRTRLAGSLSGGEQQMCALSLANRASVLESGTLVLTGAAREILGDERLKRAYWGL